MKNKIVLLTALLSFGVIANTDFIKIDSNRALEITQNKMSEFAVARVHVTKDTKHLLSGRYLLAKQCAGSGEPDFNNIKEGESFVTSTGEVKVDKIVGFAPLDPNIIAKHKSDAVQIIASYLSSVSNINKGYVAEYVNNSSKDTFSSISSDDSSLVLKVLSLPPTKYVSTNSYVWKNPKYHELIDANKHVDATNYATNKFLEAVELGLIPEKDNCFYVANRLDNEKTTRAVLKTDKEVVLDGGLSVFFKYKARELEEYKAPSIVTMAIGSASLNSSMPRQMAIQNAKVNALQQALGSTIKTSNFSSIVEQDAQLSEAFAEYTKQEILGTIENFVVLSQGGEGDNYVVRIEATINPETMLNSLDKAIGLLGNPGFYINTDNKLIKDKVSSYLSKNNIKIIDNIDDASLILNAKYKVNKHNQAVSYYETQIEMTIEEKINKNVVSTLDNVPSYLPYFEKTSSNKILKAYLLKFDKKEQLNGFVKRAVVNLNKLGGLSAQIFIDSRLKVNISPLVETLKANPNIKFISHKFKNDIDIIKIRLIGGDTAIKHSILPLIYTHSKADKKDVSYRVVGANKYEYRYKDEEISFNDDTDNTAKNNVQREEGEGFFNYIIKLLSLVWSWLVGLFA